MDKMQGDAVIEDDCLPSTVSIRGVRVRGGHTAICETPFTFSPLP